MKRRKWVKKSIPIPKVYIILMSSIYLCFLNTSACLVWILFGLDSSTAKSTHGNNLKSEQKLIIDVMEIRMGNRYLNKQQVIIWHSMYWRVFFSCRPKQRKKFIMLIIKVQDQWSYWPSMQPTILSTNIWIQSGATGSRFCSLFSSHCQWLYNQTL